MLRFGQRVRLAGSLAPLGLMSACASSGTAPPAPQPTPPAATAPSPPPTLAPSAPAKAPPQSYGPIPGLPMGRPLTKSTQLCVADPSNADPLRRQYCDKRKRRFYYFDPVKKQYFWDNGQPKL